MRWLRDHWPVWIAILFNVLAMLFVWRESRATFERKIVFSAGEVQAVHAPVIAAGRPVSGVSRLATGDAVETGADGRGRLRLDDGTVIVLDRNTRVVVAVDGTRIERGRAVVQGASAGRAVVVVAGVPVVVSGATVAIEAEAKRVYCASGEAVAQKDGEQRIHTGETATLEGAIKIAPEKAFLDWTGGMATPWSATGKPQAAIGELWGRLSNVSGDDLGSPLAIRSHAVDVRIDGEMATTRVATTYFNAGNGRVSGDFRMAMPTSAIVSRFAEEAGGNVREGRVALSKDDGPDGAPKLEWAGDGWVRAATSSLDAGATLTVIVEYVDWLAIAGDRVTYRYPMLSAGKPALIGEFRAHVDATTANPVVVHAPLGAKVEGAIVDVSHADFRPSADLVVELELHRHALRGARAYVAPALAADSGGSYVFVRTEAPLAPPAAGVTLAIVVDTSLSIGPSLLDAERGLVEALLEGLGADDRVIVLAADQDVRPVGPADLGKVDPARRAQTIAALAGLVPAGATDLGGALERAADALPANAPEAMVLYVGDGWATLGDTTIDRMRARLARRPGGIPRLGAVAVGPLANRFGLTALVRGSGPVFDVADRAGASETAVHLLAEALRPAVAGAEVDLGPHIERVYPRGARAVAVGSSVVAVGRVRGPMPNSVKLRFRRGAATVEESRMLVVTPTAQPGDVRRRWAASRVEELALRGEGREPTIDAALRTQLLTPWTAWVIGPASYRPSPLELRVLDLASMRGAPLSARLATPPSPFGALAEAPADPLAKTTDADYERAIEAATRRTLDEALPAVRACRDSRAGLRPELSGTLRVSLRLAGDGVAKKIVVVATSPRDDDPALDRCVELVVGGLVFFDGGQKTEIVVTHELRLPPSRDTRGRTCSRASTLPLGARRGVWRERLRREAAPSVFAAAKASCELPTWTDRRSLLEVILDVVVAGPSRVELARALGDLGESEAADVVRREAIRRAASPTELYQLRFLLLGDERLALGAFKKRYVDAKTDGDRLAVVRRFLRLAPHDGTLLRQLFVLLEQRGDKAQLVEEIARVRQDPFSDAAVLADGASVLARLGQRDESRRAFGELIERAPTDPFAHAFLGDRLRAEGLFEDATMAYTTLSTISPGDPAATLRLALGHAGAGRLDMASRLLARVSSTGGPRSDAKLALLAGVLDAALLGSAKATASDDVKARLGRRESELPLPDASSFVLVRGGGTDKPLDVRLLRGPKEDLEAPADVSAVGLGLHVLRVESGEKRLMIRLRRAPELEPRRSTKVRVDVLTPSTGALITRELDLAPDGNAVDLRWDGARLEPATR